MGRLAVMAAAMTLAAAVTAAMTMPMAAMRCLWRRMALGHLPLAGNLVAGAQEMRRGEAAHRLGAAGDEMAADQRFDIAQIGQFGRLDQRDRHPLGAGAGGAADAVDVGFRHVRQLEIHHMRDIVDIDAARGDIGRDEHTDAAGAEQIERALALALALVAVDRGGADAGILEMAGDLVGAVLGAGEDDGALDRDIGQQPGELVLLFLGGEEENLLVDPVDRLRFDADGDLARVAQEFAGQGTDRLRHGSRKHHRLALAGQLRHDLADRRDEAEIEHLIRLVEHHGFNPVEADGAGGDMVEQAAGSGDQQVDTRFHTASLRAGFGPADDDGDRRAGKRPIGAGGIGDLGGKLAGGGENQRAAGARRRAGAVGRDPVQDRQHEGSRLAGAGLGDADQIVAFEHHRDRTGLDRGGGFIGLLADGAQQGLGKAECGKIGQDSAFVAAPSG
ncbi:unnamed protein product [Acidocella sp. C78]|nr:unnamed protein product [Acidocella sp. C78]